MTKDDWIVLALMLAIMVVPGCTTPQIERAAEAIGDGTTAVAEFIGTRRKPSAPSGGFG